MKHPRVDKPISEAHPAPARCRTAGRKRIGPVGFGIFAILVAQRLGDSFMHAYRPNGECPQCGVILYDCWMPNTLDQFAADACIQRSNQPQP